MATIDYKELYLLQDKVFAAVSGMPTGFYLTGGTCLHRFYLEKRYSDDIDLFNNDPNLFREEVKIVRQALEQAALSPEIVVDSRDFVRLMIAGILKLDLVNDRVYRVGGTLRTPAGLALDNIVNIGANKVCALLGRDDPKDVFDLYTIFRLPEADWPEIMAAVDRKCAFDQETLRYRLQSFPLELVELLPVVDPGFAQELHRDYKTMTESLLNLSAQQS
ncbi:nucleotidyl transferase AbiEii/AbiGii toxin family protein [Desulfurivibrio sp. D14AmB]|uniref:nucleotidyl transferase AbiEii/AbiGii toxin family protein n=1 Tax=Desulfurivibrio sp. D14AmB TaxID=3374370 RepID=UPI00376EC6AE